MATVLTFIAWTIDLFLSLLSAATAAFFFLVSPAFRRQSYERWTRRYQAASRTVVARAGALNLALTALLALKRGA